MYVSSPTLATVPINDCTLGNATASCLSLQPASGALEAAIAYPYQDKCYVMIKQRDTWNNDYTGCQRLREQFTPMMDYGRMAVFNDPGTYRNVMTTLNQAIDQGSIYRYYNVTDPNTNITTLENSTSAKEFGNMSKIMRRDKRVWLGAQSIMTQPDKLWDFCWRSSACRDGSAVTKEDTNVTVTSGPPYCLSVQLDGPTSTFWAEKCDTLHYAVCELGESTLAKMLHCSNIWQCCCIVPAHIFSMTQFLNGLLGNALSSK